MTFEELMATLSEDQRGIISAKVNEKNKDSADNRIKAKQLQDTIAKIVTKLGVENIDDDVLAKLSLADGKEGADKVASLEAAVRTLRQDLTKLSTENTTLKQSQLEKSRDEAILAELGKHNIRPESLNMVRKVLAADATFDSATGEWSFSGRNISEHMGEFVKSNQYLVANPQKPGGGDQRQTNNGGSGTGEKVFTSAQVDAMSKEERAANATAILKSANNW